MASLERYARLMAILCCEPSKSESAHERLDSESPAKGPLDPYIIYLLCRWSSRQTFHNFVVPVDGPRPIQALLSLPGPAPPSHSPSRLPACPFASALKQATTSAAWATRPRLFAPSQMPLAVMTTTIGITFPFPPIPVLGSFCFPMLSPGCFPYSIDWNSKMGSKNLLR